MPSDSISVAAYRSASDKALVCDCTHAHYPTPMDTVRIGNVRRKNCPFYSAQLFAHPFRSQLVVKRFIDSRVRLILPHVDIGAASFLLAFCCTSIQIKCFRLPNQNTELALFSPSVIVSFQIRFNSRCGQEKADRIRRRCPSNDNCAVRFSASSVCSSRFSSAL